MHYQPITPAFGALVEGLDVTRLAQPMLRRLYELWQQKHVLVLRGQNADRQALRAFVAALGEAEPLAGIAPAETLWNADQSASDRPSFGCVLHGMEAPAASGALWLSCLPAALRFMAPDLVARLRWMALQHGPQVHPLVVMQPETGEPTLYLGQRRGARVLGVSEQESERLLNIVWSYATADAVTWRHRWQPGDLVLWNNLTMLHRHEAVPVGATRVLEGWRLKCRYTLTSPIQQEAA